MARKIITAADVDTGNAVHQDKYPGKLLKYIPADVIAVYLTLDHILKLSTDKPNVILIAGYVVFGILLIATPFYLLKTGVTARSQLIVATLSFAIWAFSLSGPFSSVPHHEIIAALLLPLFTFFVPLLV